MANPSVVEQFLTWAERDRLRSPSTLARYRAVLAQLPDPATANESDVEAWWATRYDKSPATRTNELACLRAFYKWAVRFDHVDKDPTRRLDAPKVPNLVPRPIGQADLERLIGPLTANDLDLRRTFALGAYGGLRVSEAASLDWSHIDVDARRIYVRGKGGKQRVVALSTVLLDKILPSTGGNVVTGGKKPYSGQTLQRKVNRLMERNGINHTFHDLRKRGASLALSRGLNPVAVQQMFGWSSMDTVKHYAVVGDEELDRIADAMV